MKKIFFLFVLAIVSSTAFSQVKFGIKAGYNNSKGSGEYFEGFDSRSSIAAGVFIKIDFLGKLAFQPEIQYSMQGASNSYINSETTFKMDYINIPLIVKYYIIGKLNVNLGPQISYLTAAKYKDDSEETDVKDTFNNQDFDLDFGLGYDLANKLCFDVRYNLGLSNISNVDGYDAQNRVFQLTVGYMF